MKKNEKYVEMTEKGMLSSEKKHVSDTAAKDSDKKKRGKLLSLDEMIMFDEIFDD